MQPDILPEIAELDQLVFGSAVHCETIRRSQHAPCGKPAAWRVLMSCCGEGTFLCEGHWTKFSTAAPRIYLVACRHCRKRFVRFSDAVVSAWRI